MTYFTFFKEISVLGENVGLAGSGVSFVKFLIPILRSLAFIRKANVYEILIN